MTPLVDLQFGREPLRRLFAGFIEQVFQVQIGLCDTALTDYLGELLTDFVHVERIQRLKLVDSDIIREASRLEAEAVLRDQANPSRRRRLINKFVGDYTLFWTGVYPEQLRPRQQGGVDRLDAYLVQGRRSYGIASELTGPEDLPPGAVLRALSENFECCVHGLHLVRASWERTAKGDGLN